MRSITTYPHTFKAIDQETHAKEAEAEKWLKVVAAERYKDLEGNFESLVTEERNSY